MSNNDNDPRRAHRMSDWDEGDTPRTTRLDPYSAMSFVFILVLGLLITLLSLAVLYGLSSVDVLHPRSHHIWPPF
jgi:hypothetical protein